MDMPQKTRKSTRLRRLVRECLDGKSEPVTAKQIYNELSEAGETLWLSTVYRALDALEEDGLAVCTLMQDGSKHYEAARHIHGHRAVCQSCGRKEYLESCPVSFMAKEARKLLGFTVTGHRLELYGYCRTCSEKKK